MQSVAGGGPVYEEGCNRALDGLVSRHERSVLEWLAARVPAGVLPDHLTALGVAGAGLVAVALAASHLSPVLYWLALAGLALNWLGDSLDGTLARVRRIERPRYGFFVDHVSDLASQTLIVLGLGLSPLMRLDLATLALSGYLAISVYTFVKLHVTRNMQLSYFGVGPTEIRLLIGAGLVGAATIGVVHLDTPAGRLSVFDAGALVLVAFAALSAIAMFVRDARALALIDPRHGRPVEVRLIEVAGTASERSGTAAPQTAGPTR